MTRFIAVVSGKGGVGKTTVAINLGTALANSGKDTVVLDGNITTPHIGLYLGYPNPPKTLHHAINNQSKIEETVYRHNSGLKIIPGSINMNMLENLKLSKIKSTIKQLQGYAETILIDTGAGMTNENKAVMNIADEILIVTNPEFAAVTDALKSVKDAEKQGKLVLGAILNKVHPTGNELSIKNIQSLLNIPVLETIPQSNSIKQSRIQKHPLVYQEPSSDISIKFKKLAEKLK